MNTRTKILLATGAIAAAVLFIFATRGIPPPTPNPPGTWSFAVLGDAPYGPFEQLRHAQVLQALNQHDLSFVIHVGDIFWRPCSDQHYNQALGWYNGLRHPVVYTPGDNEWIDCWQPGSGAFVPRERLGSLRQIFYSHPGRSLGAETIPLKSQGGHEPYAEFVENARWSHA